MGLAGVVADLLSGFALAIAALRAPARWLHERMGGLQRRMRGSCPRILGLHRRIGKRSDKYECCVSEWDSCIAESESGIVESEDRQAKSDNCLADCDARRATLDSCTADSGFVTRLVSRARETLCSPKLSRFRFRRARHRCPISPSVRRCRGRESRVWQEFRI